MKKGSGHRPSMRGVRERGGGEEGVKRARAHLVVVPVLQRTLLGAVPRERVGIQAPALTRGMQCRRQER